MNPDKKDESKKSPSNSIIFIIMGLIVAMILIQNFLQMKVARVSFSYQLEYLVDLDLMVPQEARKTATANNLVTFSGIFRDEETQEGKNRFKYLSTLDSYHEQTMEKNRLNGELSDLKQKVLEAGDLYVKIAGIEVGPTGWKIVEDFYDSPDRENRIVITANPPKTFSSLKEVQEQFNGLSLVPQAEQKEKLNSLFSSLEYLIKNLRSPTLGIGSEQMKGDLRKLEFDLAGFAMLSFEEQSQKVATSLKSVQKIVDDLATVQNHMRLTQLRSIRRYKELVDQYSAIAVKIEDTSLALDKARDSVADVIWYYNNNELTTRALEKQESEVFHQWFLGAQEEWKNFDQNRGAFFKAPDQPSNKVLERVFRSEEPSPNYFSYLISIAPVFLILLLLYFAFSRQMKGMGGAAMDFGKSPARLFPKGTTKVTFKDVAGIDESLEELQEVVEFLKNPQKFTALGGRIPKGLLCIGPPGSGKTLVAKAVAGEADCPFFSISGSDFVEMFVGVGASRIRKMFEEAKRNAPCIIFIDEIDAVGRHRGGGIGGGHDEREQTLNQLLVEMDGFDTQEGVIIIAATNRPDVLDKALLRPGRFDRQVFIPLPDIKGRFAILKVHAKKIKLDEGVDLMAVARGTPGCSGADLENLLNEAALLAARKERTAVTEQDVFEARDKVLYGKERRSLELDLQEKKTTAYHESGHTIVSLFSKHADPIDKVTIIPRGFSLGATMFLPTKNRVSYWKSELLDQLSIMMGGRASEEIFLGDVSSGAKQDIERATQLARSMVCEWGMSEIVGTVTYDERQDNGQFLGLTSWKEKLYSEKTSQTIDAEVRRFIDEAYSRAVTIIKENKESIETMAKALMEFETLDLEDVQKIVKHEWNEEEKKAKFSRYAAMNKKTEFPKEGTVSASLDAKPPIASSAET